MVHQGIDECSACMSRCRMHNHALRFVDDNDIIILIARMFSAPMRVSSNFAVASQPKKQGAISSNFAGILVPFLSVGVAAPPKNRPAPLGQARFIL